MNDAKKDYIFFSIVILFAIVFLVLTPQIKITNASFTVGPRNWPYILLILMLILSSFGIISSFVKSKKAKATEPIANKEDKQHERALFKLSIPVLSLLSVIVYVLLLNTIGFILSSLLFLFGLTFLLGERKKLNAFIFSIVTTIIFVVLFSIILNIPLPRGMGIFRQISLLFY